MVIAVAVEVSSALEAESAFSIALRVQLHHLKLVGCHVGQKGYVVGFGHGVMDGDELLVFRLFDLDFMVFIQRFSLQSRKGHTAAADDGISHGVNDVAADGADIQFGAEQIGGRILVDDDGVRNARLALLLATRQVLRNGLALLGISAPEKM